jgi:lysozyme
MKVSGSGIEGIRAEEKFRPKAYLDSVGVWTIGYGSTAGVQQGDTITKEEAERRLLSYVIEIEAALSPLMPEGCKQNEFDALASIAYNVGVGAVRGSNCLAHFRAGRKCSAIAEMVDWVMGEIEGKKVPILGLVRRRHREALLFAGEE